MQGKRELARVRAERRESRRVFSVTVARRELRKWLRSGDEGRRVEAAVAQLLNDPEQTPMAQRQMK